MPKDEAQNSGKTNKRGGRWRGRLSKILLMFFALASVFILLEAVLRYREHNTLRAGTMVEFTTDPAFFDIPSVDIGKASAFRWDRDGNGPLHRRSENPLLVHELRPSAQINAAISINAQGYRDDPFSQDKPEGVFRVAIIGGALTLGLSIQQEDIYPHVLERLLNENCRGHTACEVYNFGVGGYSTAQKLEVLRTKVLRYQPDLILLQYGGNDNAIGSNTALLRHFTRSWSHAYDFLRRHLGNLVSRCRQGDVVTHSFKAIAGLCAREDLPVAALLFPGAAAEPGKISRDHREIQECGIPVLLLAEAFAALGTDSLIDSTYGRPNLIGHYIAAEEIYWFLLAKPELGLAAACQAPPRKWGEARAALARAIQAQNEDQKAEALANYRQAVKAQPAYAALAAHAVAAFAETFYVRGRAEDAFPLAQEAANFDPACTSAQTLLAQTRLSQGLFDEAATVFRNAIQAGDRNAAFLDGLGTSLNAAGDTLGAANIYTELLESWQREYEDLIEAPRQGSIRYASYRENGRPAAWEILVPMRPEVAAPTIQIFLDAETQYAAAGERDRAKEMRAKAEQTYRLANLLSTPEAHLHETYATAMEEHGQLDAATAAYRRANTLDEESVPIRAGLARCLLATGKEVEGRELLRQAALSAPGQVARILPGLSPKHALIVLEAALSAAPQDVSLHRLCAQLHRRANDPKAAAETLEKALILAPQDQVLRFEVATTWFDANEPGKGTAALGEAVQRDPQCRPAAAKALLQAGDVFLEREDWTKAGEAFIAALRWDTSLAAEAAALCLQNGQRLLDSARNKEAAWLYEKAYAFNPNNYNACSGWGKALALTEGIDRTISFFRQTGAKHAEWKEMLAQELMDIGTDWVPGENFKAAQKALRAAATLNPNRAGEAALALQSGAEAHTQAGQIEVAAALYREAAEIAPSACQFHRLATEALYQTSGPKEVLAYLKRAAQKGDDCAYAITQALLDAGRALLQAALWQDAAEALAEAAKTDTTAAGAAAEILAGAGQARLVEDDPRTAEYLYAQARTIAPEDTRATIGHAQALAKLDRFQEALALLAGTQESGNAAETLFKTLLERWIELVDAQDWAKAGGALLAAVRTIPDPNVLFMRWNKLSRQGLPLDEAMRTYRREVPSSTENRAAWIAADRVYRAVGIAPTPESDTPPQATTE